MGERTDEEIEEEWRRRIGVRLAEVRRLGGVSLSQLEAATTRAGKTLGKSRLSNYEQGLRMLGVWEAALLGPILEESPAHLLCLDEEDMPALSKKEAELIRNFRVLPENQREEYAERIESLALAYRKPISDERVRRTAYNPKKRPKVITRKLKSGAS